MANKTNQYGRQIFLTREQIQELRDLVCIEMVTCDDNIQHAQEYLQWESGVGAVRWQEDIDLYQKRKHNLKRLYDKLWYYVSDEEI